MRCSAAALPLMLGFLLAGLAACTPTPDIVVNTTADQDDAAPGDGVCANLGALGSCSLRAAVQEANARPVGSSSRIQILNSGTYVLGAGDGSGRGLVIQPGTKLVTIEGCCTGAASTTIQPEQPNQRLFTIDGGVVVMRDLRLTGGRAPGSPLDANPEKDGGAILLRGAGSRLSLERVIVEDNEAGRQGGGIWTSDDPGMLLLVSDSVIRNNTAANAGVGGAGGIHSGAETGITRTLVEGNRGNSGGLRLYRDGGDAHEITRSTFRDNITSNNGGGIRIDTPGGQTVISFSTFSRNQTDSASGAGTAIQVSEGDLQLRSSTISENGVAFSRPALLVSFDASATLRSTVVAQNDTFGDDQPDVYCSATAALVLNGWNLIDGINPECPVADPNLIEPDLTGPLDADLGFYQAEPIGHYPLNPGSPALDGGLFICDGTDQIGTARPQDGNGDGFARCDIGAIEQPEG